MKNLGIEVRPDFYNLYEKFKKNKFSLEDIALLIEVTRRILDSLTDEEISELLEIPLIILKNDVTLTQRPPLPMCPGSYLSGNLNQPKGEVIGRLKTKFENEEYGLEDFITLTEYCRDNIHDLRSCCDFFLRNPEVILRDFCIIKNQNHFVSNGNTYANVLSKIFDL